QQQQQQQQQQQILNMNSNMNHNQIDLGLQKIYLENYFVSLLIIFCFIVSNQINQNMFQNQSYSQIQHSNQNQNQTSGYPNLNINSNPNNNTVYQQSSSDISFPDEGDMFLLDSLEGVLGDEENRIELG